MNLCKYFKLASALPTPKESGPSMHATTEANKAVERALERETEAKSIGRKRKHTSTFTTEEWATIGKYVAENRNAKASRKNGVGESTVRLFKSKYPAALKAKVQAEVEEDMEAIPTGRHGRPLLIGEQDKDVQKYIFAFHDAGPAISTSLTITAAEENLRREASPRPACPPHHGQLFWTEDRSRPDNAGGDEDHGCVCAS